MLDAHVLVLNRVYQPVNLTDVRRALCMMYLGVARALDRSCCYCARRLPRRQLNLAQVLPRSRGGKSNRQNVVTSCRRCNCHRGGHTPLQAGMRLMRSPTKPRWAQLVHRPRLQAEHQEWWPFLNPIDASYWNTELESD